MAVLQPSEYDQAYFDGKIGPLEHVAGYSKYKRWPRYDTGILTDINDCTGEYFRDIAKYYIDKYNMAGKKALELGCAYGFIVEDLRDMGVDAYGIDVSQYAYDQASSAVKPYLTVADARTHLNTYSSNEFDLIYSRWFLECIDDSDLPDLIKDMNAKSMQQVHIVHPQLRADYYNPKSVQDWLSYKFENGTVIVDSADLNTLHTK